jgi:hypothetical protein
MKRLDPNPCGTEVYAKSRAAAVRWNVIETRFAAGRLPLPAAPVGVR